MQNSRHISPAALKDWEQVQNKEQAIQWHQRWTPWWQRDTIETIVALYPHLIFLTEKEKTDKFKATQTEFEKLMIKSV